MEGRGTGASPRPGTGPTLSGEYPFMGAAFERPSDTSSRSQIENFWGFLLVYKKFKFEFIYSAIRII